MKRFCGVKGNSGKGVIGEVGSSVIVFAVVLLLFLFAVGKMSEQTLEEQQRYLEEAVEQSLLQCYVTEGRYPESFAYLEEKYGLVYDKEHFRVDYRIYGSNMWPEVEVLVLEATD